MENDFDCEEIGVRKRKAVVASTVRRWLRKQGLNWRDVKKGVYVDGHERQDVVEYRERFIESLEELWPYIVEFEDDGTIVNKVYPENCVVGGLDRQPIILVTHDESTFSSNDGRRQAWTGPSRQFLRPKGREQGIMVSDFLLPWCRLSTESLTEEERGDTQLPLYATKYLEYGKAEGYWDGKDLVAHVIEVALPMLRKIYPGYQILFLFDNSSNHGTYADDALRVQSMSLISKNIPCARRVAFASGYQAQNFGAHDARCVLWLVAILTCARCVRGSIAIHSSLWTLLAS